jgi:hypothetical protein
MHACSTYEIYKVDLHLKIFNHLITVKTVISKSVKFGCNSQTIYHHVALEFL